MNFCSNSRKGELHMGEKKRQKASSNVVLAWAVTIVYTLTIYYFLPRDAPRQAIVAISVMLVTCWILMVAMTAAIIFRKVRSRPSPDDSHWSRI